MPGKSGFGGTGMTPFEYLDRYHSLQVIDGRLDIHAVVDIKNYISGWQGNQMQEYGNVLEPVAKYFHLKGWAAVPEKFWICDGTMDCNEAFYRASVRRTFEGRGSPDDMADTLRLAVWSKRCKAAQAGTYAAQWFGQDCNSFVGNYLGISPSTSIAAYAHGYGHSPTLSGATPDVYTSRYLVPLEPDSNYGDIAQGDVLCTFGSPDNNGNRWRHIGIVQDITLLGPGSDTRQDAVISIAEWGTNGGVSVHRVEGKQVKLKRGKLCPELPGKVVTAFDGTDPQGNTALRIFFDASPLYSFDSRGWSVANVEGV